MNDGFQGSSVFVTKPFLPPLEEYQELVEGIWSSNQLTNGGATTQKFEKQLCNYLEVSNFHFVANGTIALQLALSGLGINDGEVITTPFSYVATTSVILWQKCEPVYADIDPHTLCINPDKIESLITKKTKAIMPVHVFGNACDLNAIEDLANHYNLKVIYDAAHAFAVTCQGKSLLEFGDVSTLSFHATKLFHTAEGGGIVSKSRDVHDLIELQKRFGHNGDTHHVLGINAKPSELHAALGLTNLKYANDILEQRRQLYSKYDELLADDLYWYRQRLTIEKYNHAYYPIIFDTEEITLLILNKLSELSIFPRRYFFPSLNELPYLKDRQQCPNSESISRRIICLPLYVGLSEDTIQLISEVIHNV
ncbi:MAG: DegT/DnrJ/EryC1/StrS family aminotransferase [Coriobacteriales bacterium]|nr:DegT/DnrJ/EryC1/StrS family aminotransferase [Coriobacteriales bacterium]